MIDDLSQRLEERRVARDLICIRSSRSDANAMVSRYGKMMACDRAPKHIYRVSNDMKGDSKNEVIRHRRSHSRLNVTSFQVFLVHDLGA